MAIRYSGNVRISVMYRDQGDYKCSVSGPGGRWSGVVRPAPSGFGAGVGYDSPKAYDEVAHAALSFAANDKRGIDEEADYTDSGYAIRRTKAYRAARSPTRRLTSTKRLPASRKKPHGRKGQSLGWELWTKGDRYDPPHFVRAYKDKGEAQRFMKRLVRSNGNHYMLKRTKGEPRTTWGAHRQKRADSNFWKRKDDGRDRSRKRRSRR